MIVRLILNQLLVVTYLQKPTYLGLLIGIVGGGGLNYSPLSKRAAGDFAPLIIFYIIHFKLQKLLT